MKVLSVAVEKTAFCFGGFISYVIPDGLLKRRFCFSFLVEKEVEIKKD